MSRRVAEKSGGRTRAAKYTPTTMSRHFLVFDGTVSRAQRIGFYIAANAVLPPTEYAGDVTEPRLITDPMHPAFRQFGLFAKVRIPSQTILMCYGGFIQRHGSFPCSQAYTMGYGGLNDELEIDSEFIGNLARFANDPRGIPGSPHANIVAQTKHTRLGETYAAILTKRIILPGEELLLSYGPGHRLSSHFWETRSGQQLTRPRLMPPHPRETITQLGLTLWWQCAQCGTWTRHPDSPLSVCLCGLCRAPRAARAPMCAMDAAAAACLTTTTTSTTTGVESSSSRHQASNHRDFSAPSDCQTNSDVDNPLARRPPRSEHERGAVCENELAESNLCTSSIPSPWPLDFPLITWQIWDTHVPHDVIQEYAVFHGQSSIAIIEHVVTGRSSITANGVFEAGSRIAAVGGLLVHEDDPRIFNAPFALRASDMCDGLDDTSRSGVSPQLCLLPCNEVALIQHTTLLSAANVKAEILRDPLGFLWVALVALKDIDIDEELMLHIPSAVDAEVT